jgi:predicted RNA methylase
MKSEKNSPLRTSDLDFRSLQPSKTIQDTSICHGRVYVQPQVENVDDFQGKLAMDLGAGSGILSFFAVQVTMGSWPG